MNNVKPGQFLIILVAVLLGVYFAWQQTRHDPVATPSPPACAANAECAVSGVDEREQCVHASNTAALKDATSKTHDGNACLCIASQCRWADKEAQACLKTG